MAAPEDYTRFTDDIGLSKPPDSGADSRADYTRYSDKAAPEPSAASKVMGADDATLFSEPPQSSTKAHLGDELPDLSTGPRIIKDRFVLEKLIGVGGMGAVYKARDLRRVEAQDRNPWVAVKLINNKFKKHPAAFLSLQREASKSQTLAHPNIVPVYDFDRADNLVFMTMELQTGASLEKVIKSNPGGIPYSRAVKITQEAGRALQYAHDHNIVHADFKPGNVFLTEAGRVKIFDFGIARAVKHVDAAVAEVDTAFDPSTLGGLTPAYATWEMLEGEEPDASDDVYALACMLYELLSGQHPYRRVPVNRAWRKFIWPKRIKSIKRLQWKVLSRALSLRRKRRYLSVQNFLDDFIGAEVVERAELPAAKIFSVVAVALTWILFSQTYVLTQEREASQQFEQIARQWTSDAQTIRHFGVVQRERLSATLLSDLSRPENYQEMLALREESESIYEDASWLDLYAKKVLEFPDNFVNRWQQEKTFFGNEVKIHQRWLKRFDVRLGFLGVLGTPSSVAAVNASSCDLHSRLALDCEDFLPDGQSMPMVRLPFDSSGATLVMAKNEVSIRDFNRYCEATGKCRERKDALWPVTGLSLVEVEDYLGWLSAQTGFQYRLPTLSQWQRAALAGYGEYRTASNCRLAQSRFTNSSAGIRAADDGESNPWGLVNMVGNAQEMVRANFRVVAAGSHYLSGAKACDPYQVSTTLKEGDSVTGFRYVRRLGGQSR